MHVVFVATDMMGSKLNYELEFPAQPSVGELIRHIEAVFTEENRLRKVVQQYKVAKLNVVDDVSEDWVEVLAQGQLKNYCQVYAFQPHSTQLTESQGHIPAAVRPRHINIQAGAPAPTPAAVTTAAYQSPPSTYQVPPQPSYVAPLSVPRSASAVPVASNVPGMAQVRLLPQDASHDEKVRACFEGLDANTNRVIELDEFKRGFQMFGMDFSPATMDDLFRKGDIDNDGVISFPEWQRFSEVYPTMLDSLYFRLKSHWEIVAAKNELDQLSGAVQQMQVWWIVLWG